MNKSQPKLEKIAAALELDFFREQTDWRYSLPLLVLNEKTDQFKNKTKTFLYPPFLQYVIWACRKHLGKQYST